jgi:uncharacterized protein (UPF0264 family)
LLISVRSAEEAVAALDGGADWIDVKEPHHGPLGAATCETIEQIVRAVAGRAPISIAAGELVQLRDLASLRQFATSGVLYVKVGLSHIAQLDDWRLRWRAIEEQVFPAGLVAVVYADWQRAAAPDPDEVLRLAQRHHTSALLVDTFDKTQGNLLDCWPLPALADFVARVHHSGIGLVLAGSLDQSSIPQAAALGPALIGVRGAACDDGRGGRISLERVAQLRKSMGQPHSNIPPPQRCLC